MFNKPTGDIAEISLGPGVISIGAVGATPTIDVGHVKGGMTLTIDRAMVDIRAGSPQTLIKRLSAQEDAMIEFTGIQWDLDNLARVLGDGQTSISGGSEVMEIGGRPNGTEISLKFVHKMADGGTIEMDVYKAIGDGIIAVAVNEADTHEMPYKFMAMDPGETGWDGAALTDGKKLVKFLRTAGA